MKRTAKVLVAPLLLMTAWTC